MSGMQARQIVLTLSSPAAPGTLIPTRGSGLGGIVVGLDDCNLLMLTIAAQQTPGGTLDIYFQTTDTDPTGLYAGPWVDVLHLPQLAAGSTTIRYRILFSRVYGAPVVPQVINPTDTTPTLAVNTTVSWANGSAIRVVIVAGAGVAAAAVQQIAGMAVIG